MGLVIFVELLRVSIVSLSILVSSFMYISV